MPPEAAAVTATTATATETTTATSQSPWYQGKFTAPEDVGWLQNKGWHDKPANDVAYEAIKSFRELEKMRGVPADQIVKWPKDLGDAEGWQTIRNKLGVPKEAKDYDFSGVKFGDGTPLDDGFVEMMRLTAHKNGMTKDAASAVAREMVNFMAEAERTEAASLAAQHSAAKAELKKSWGANYDVNLFVAKNAARQFGVSQEEIDKFDDLNPRALNTWLQIGQKIGEDKFVTSDTGRGPGRMMTPEQAELRWRELLKDDAWQKRWMAGDADARREKDALDRLRTREA